MFLEITNNIISRVQVLEQDYILESEFEYSILEIFPSLENDLLNDITKDKINILNELSERIRQSLGKDFEFTRAFELIDGTNEKLLFESLDGMRIKTIILDELSVCKKRIDELIGRYEIKALEKWEWSENPIKLNISVSHLGILIDSFYDMGIINKKDITKSELCRLVSKYFITKTAKPLSHRSLLNSLSTNKGSEIVSFKETIIEPLLAFSQKTSVDPDKRKENNLEK